MKWQEVETKSVKTQFMSDDGDFGRRKRSGNDCPKDNCLCAGVRRQLREAGLRATALVARTRLVTPVETAENIPSLLIQRQTKA